MYGLFTVIERICGFNFQLDLCPASGRHLEHFRKWAQPLFPWQVSVPVYLPLTWLLSFLLEDIQGWRPEKPIRAGGSACFTWVVWWPADGLWMKVEGVLAACGTCVLLLRLPALSVLAAVAYCLSAGPGESSCIAHGWRQKPKPGNFQPANAGLSPRARITLHILPHCYTARRSSTASLQRRISRRAQNLTHYTERRTQDAESQHQWIDEDLKKKTLVHVTLLSQTFDLLLLLFYWFSWIHSCMILSIKFTTNCPILAFFWWFYFIL